MGEASEQNTSLETGNTKNGFKLKARSFQLTIFDLITYDGVKASLTKYKSLKYFASCKEKCPDTGRMHIHIYVQYSNMVVLDTAKLGYPHLERIHGTPEQARDYIFKLKNPETDKILDEIGEFRTNGGYGGITIKQALSMSKDELYDRIDMKYFNVVNKILDSKDRINCFNNYIEHKHVVYIYGDSGCGKSYNANKLMQKYCKLKGLDGNFDEVKYTNKFWIGTHPDELMCCYDDFRDSSMKPQEFINFVDYRYHNFNIKGGERIFKYKIILITSIKTPWELYINSNEEQKQWLKRMKIYTVENNHLKKVPNEYEYEE